LVESIIDQAMRFITSDRGDRLK